MTNNSNDEAAKYQALCWISRILLIAACLSRWVYLFFVWRSDPWSDISFELQINLIFTIPVIIVIITAWFAPRAGCILALFSIFPPLLLAFFNFLHPFGEWFYDWGLIPQVIFLATGGILSLIWGNWRVKNKQGNE